MGMKLVGVMDADLSKIGNKIGGVEVQSIKKMDEIVSKNDAKIRNNNSTY